MTTESNEHLFFLSYYFWKTLVKINETTKNLKKTNNKMKVFNKY